ncbi:hypothetical protein MATL_G00131360 [Megalops atlanticus]|uniref:Mitochondrial assembly of ribosomal large subunit protein 1 n=1 Tax=Megalops atlanticus TaxID=7932 RepID=A0A9D3PWI4_MEGAT|nr:hypothetical protein MATL_G00131360 [Megalops atlanticus]
MVYTHVFSCSKRILMKICHQHITSANLRFLKSPRANLGKHGVMSSWRYYASGSHQLHPCHSARLIGRISTFCTYVHTNNGDLTKHGMGTLEEQKYDTDSEAEKGPRQSTGQVFNIDALVSVLRQENAADICVIKIPKEMKYTDYFVVVSGSSTRHLRAMAHYAVKVYKYLKEESDPHIQIEGKDAEDWMCIDFGDMVVHFMLPETRELYELEKLWTLRSFDEQLSSIPPETLPMDFIYEAELTK